MPSINESRQLNSEALATTSNATALKLRTPSPDSDFSLLIVLPGIGEAVGVFSEFSNSLSGNWMIYGMQFHPAPQDTHYPSIESLGVAYFNIIIRELASKTTKGIYIVGYSHGGLVAHELCVLLDAHGVSINLLSLIDSNPPSGKNSPILKLEDIQREFLDSLSCKFSIDLEGVVLANDPPNNDGFIDKVHEVLIQRKLIPKKCMPNTIKRAFWEFFDVSIRLYYPATIYNGMVALAQASDPRLNLNEDAARRASHADNWKIWAPNIQVWHAPGNHYSLLKSPHVIMLIEWFNSLFEIGES